MKPQNRAGHTESGSDDTATRALKRFEAAALRNAWNIAVGEELAQAYLKSN